MSAPLKQRIRVLLIDDHTLFRRGVRALLERHAEFDVVADTGCGLEGLRLARELAPDVVLLDLHMPGLSGKEVLRGLDDAAPRAHVSMLTVSEDSADLLECLKLGAQGYLLKDIDAAFLASAVRRTADGDAVMSSAMTGKLIQSMCPPASTAGMPASPEPLSPREREVVALLAQGATNKDIARALDLAESTVKMHVQSVLRKFGAKSRVQIVLHAISHGLVDSSSDRRATQTT